MQQSGWLYAKRGRPEILFEKPCGEPTVLSTKSFGTTCTGRLQLLGNGAYPQNGKSSSQRCMHRKPEDMSQERLFVEATDDIVSNGIVKA